MSSDIRQIVDDCLADDPSAMMRLINRFRGQVFALCYRMLGQWQDAEDAVQETFVRVDRSLDRWDSSRAFEPWLMTIAANRCRSQLARRNRQPTVEAIAEVHATDVSSSEQQLANHLAEEVNRVLNQIRPEWSEAFRLFHEQELSYAEIGDRMKCPIGTAKTWVHRARRQVIQRLQQREILQES